MAMTRSRFGLLGRWVPSCATLDRTILSNPHTATTCSAARSTSAVIAATPLNWQRRREPVERVALRACSEPHGHEAIEPWVLGQHSDGHHQRTCEPGNRFGGG